MSTGGQWLDMSGFPDLDPDLAVGPRELAALHDAVAAPVPELAEEDWAHLFDVAFDPGEELVDVAADGFDDAGGEEASFPEEPVDGGGHDEFHEDDPW